MCECAVRKQAQKAKLGAKTCEVDWIVVADGYVHRSLVYENGQLGVHHWLVLHKHIDSVLAVRATWR